jgi:hypothetical protein
LGSLRQALDRGFETGCAETLERPMSYSRREVSFGFSEGSFHSGTHVCYLHGEQDSGSQLIARFLDAGWRDDERLAYICDGRNPDQVRADLAKSGFPFATDPRFVVMSAQEFYLPDGTFSAENMKSRIQQFYKDAIEQGYSGGRGTGEMTWATGDKVEVLRYEAMLTEWLAEYPATCICQYDVRVFGGETIMDILSVHPYTIVRGQLVRNPYFVPPAEFLERYGAVRSE